MTVGPYKNMPEHFQILDDVQKELNGQIALDIAEKLAKDHVDWFLRAVGPLLIMNFIHGYKHGKEDK